MATDDWRPGSFTKNFSWGSDRGLRDLYDVIKIGFDNRLEDVPRKTFQNRLSDKGRLWHIPANFFLYNRVKSGIDFIVVDELVFQALNFKHSASFDKLALYAFNLSSVGHWKKAEPYQRQPARWAYYFVSDYVNKNLSWNIKDIKREEIQNFVSNDPRYKANTSTKLSTNLAHLYKIGRLDEYRSPKAERWWLSSLFLTLDRYCMDLISEGRIPEESKYEDYLIRSGFHQISGQRSIEKDLAAHNFVDLYRACGGISRFSEQATLERQRIRLPDVRAFANNPEPVGVFHPSNPRARGAIPRACAMLAQYLADFEWISIDELDDFDVESYVKSRTQQAVERLANEGISPKMTVDDLLRMTRGE